MNRTTLLQERRMQTFHDVLGHWQARRLSALEAAELLGMSERSFRRYRQRYEDEGPDGLFDRRLGKASARRVPADQVAWVLDEYRSRYRGWTVKHFHDRLRRAPRLRLELHLDQDHPAARGPGLQGAQTWRPPSPTRAQALRRHDGAGRLAVSGWPACRLST